ncbi:MAG: exonuclease domain-containing protein [Acidibacillus sp.]|uniref:DNA polymerase III PolC-type n=1 Tax=Sulfoacidibacillus ferrooxidans TaxID=2005001 RepID=A0A9X1V638_9BACL|nr:exonuclease domain-containing protein [Sulfoacidibacillus ferrooxidans]MCI0181875.1 DNA polymerase III PolC-type [Sulfoacidibacillus ferrooxidans]MCY0892828.1 exonuclease domain-containing protein [Acidibacillus sp.]
MGFERIRVWRHLFGGSSDYGRVDQFETFQGQVELRNMIHAMREQGYFEKKLKDLQYVVIDTESTGFSLQLDVLLSVAAVAFPQIDDHQVASHYCSFIKLQQGMDISDTVQELTGITRKHVENAPSLVDVLQQLVVFIDDRVVVAHHAGHDMGFLNAGLRKTWGMELTVPVIDTGEVALHLHEFHKYPTLDMLLHLYDIAVLERHTALGDAWMTTLVWQKQLELLLKENVETLGSLWEIFIRERQKKLN